MQLCRQREQAKSNKQQAANSNNSNGRGLLHSRPGDAAAKGARTGAATTTPAPLANGHSGAQHFAPVDGNLDPTVPAAGGTQVRQVAQTIAMNSQLE